MNRIFILTISLLILGCSKGLKHPYAIETPVQRSVAFEDSVEVLWQRKFKAYPNQVLFVNDSLMLTGDSRGGVTTLNINTGERTDRYWKPLKRPIQLYAHVDSVLYFSAESEYKVIAWDLNNAEMLWDKKFDVDYHKMIAVDSILYAQSDTSLAKITTSGERVSSVLVESKLAEGIVHAGDKIHICAENGELLRLNQQLERIDALNLNLPMVEAIHQKGNRLVAYNSEGGVRIVDLKLFDIIFSQNFDQALYAAPSLAHGLLIVPFAKGTVSAYSLKGGSLEWSYSQNNLLNLNLLVSEENIIAVYATGQVVSIDPDTGNEQWQYNQDESLTFAAMTPKGLLLGHRREINFVGNSHED